ncbi:unnamed protein product [Rotaria magnacalcarata]|uniref:Uncharacterized protein n=1 Tax=Rotaria magnacalcarata TaxID=392030 RepID=A0A820JGV3_9BILA|nr:unnamed protein product [Rotaria magnacalcarata]CAF4292138.1 unnamed protein product [Rotaria magnacalcarata]CAF4325285.1 unnamed protein product [Rotaria magnacalcarata]
MNFGLHSDTSLVDTSILPNDIFTRVDDDFYSIVKLLADDSVFDILRMQLINSARKLLNIDVFAFFQIESEETDTIKAESCFKSKTGQYIVKPGIQTGLSNLIKLLKQKLKQDEELAMNENNETQHKYISEEFIDRHPLLKSLIKWYQQNDSEDNNKTNRYTGLIKKFAISLYVLGGKQCYEFVRLNMPGAIPNLSTLGDLINKSNMTLTEAEFKFDSLRQFQSGFGFCSEDTTGVIPKVEHDSSTNSFIGFTTSIVDGIPLTKHYQADTFDDFKMVYNTNEIARLLNVHMFQSISAEDNPTNFPKPLLLSAYGVDNKFTAMDILRRWMYIFENCLDKGARIIGFSTDADNKYVSAMRLASNFFASLPNFKLDKHQHAFKIDIPNDWTWFFLNRNQIFLFFQDPVHIVTKWRNRLLSSTAKLCIGNDNISMAHIEQLINNNNYTKLDHGLTISDINPKDRQNYNSCIKLISDDVINLLNDSVDSNGTIVYLTLLKMIIKAYIDKSTSIRERIQSAWCVVFVCRLWWSWLEKTSTLKLSKTGQRKNERKTKINKYFITRPAYIYISIELNAHNLLYLVLLVKQQHLPKQTLINIHLFNSQPCESLFRDARSLSSTFSTMVNFTVKDFIRRSQKLSILNQLKYDQSGKDLSFPIHHKHKREHSLTSSHQLDEIDTLDIEQLILNAYNQAIHLIKHSKMLHLLNQHKINCLNDLSTYIFNILNKNSRMINYSFRTENITDEEFGLDEDNDDNDVVNYAIDQPIDEILFDFQHDVVSDDDYDILNSTKSDFNGIRVVDNINPALRQSYFKVKINDNIKYIHKQSACWLQSNQITKLSSDRLSRVIQQTSDNN